MRVLCEVVVTDILPTLRSLLTNELVKSHNLSQTEISKRLGITQPAVSQYRRGIRGSKAKKILKSRVITQEIKKLAKIIAKENFSPVEAHIRLCQISEKLIQAKIFGYDDIAPGPCVVAGERFGK